MVPPDSDRVSPAPPYSGYHYLHIAYAYGAFTLCGAAFQAASTSLCLGYCGPTTPGSARPSMVWATSRSLATTWEITVVFSSSSYLDVSVRRVRLHPKVDIPINRDGLPHSDTRGSTLLCSSPRIFAAWHVLHRHCMPRHPPYALFYFYLAWLAQSAFARRQSILAYMSSICYLDLKKITVYAHAYTHTFTTITSKNSPCTSRALSATGEPTPDPARCLKQPL